MVALLLAFTLSTDISRSSENYDLLAALILTPAFITAIVTPAIIKRLAEESGRLVEGNDRCQLKRLVFHNGCLIDSTTANNLHLMVCYCRRYSIGSNEFDVMLWLWLFAFVIIDLSVAASALHLMVSDLTRAGAVAGILLQLVLIWPFLQMTSALTSIMSNGMSFELAPGEPIADIAIAWLTVVLLWAMAVIIPED